MQVVWVVQGLTKSIGSLMAVEYLAALAGELELGDKFGHALCPVLGNGALWR